jgi:exonuclease III
MSKYLLTEDDIKQIIFDFMFNEYQPDEEEQEQHNSYKNKWFKAYQKQLKNKTQQGE